MTPRLEHEAQLEFELGGPAYRLMQRVGLIRGAGPSIRRRIAGFFLVTWVPLLLFALVEGRALGPTPAESFLLDFSTYARFFLAIPLLFVSEAIVGPRLRAAGLHFVRAGLVRDEDLPAVEAAVVRAARRREALAPELVMLGVALVGAWFLSLEILAGGGGGMGWNSATLPDGGLSLTGLWYHFVAVPLLQFFMLRWLWRLVIWTGFLRDMARLPLKIVATHPDRAGGLGFLGNAHLTLALFAFAFGCVLSAHVGYQVYFESVAVMSFKAVFVVYLVLMVLITLGPLLVFAPLLARTRREGLRDYGMLANTYNRAFEQKWVRGGAPADEPLLGSGDIQSLADLGNSFAVVKEMKVFPFSQQLVVQVAIIASLPGLPLIFLVMPVGELLQLLAGALL